MKARKLTPYVPQDADRAETYALQFQKLIACATVSVKDSHSHGADGSFYYGSLQKATLYPPAERSGEGDVRSHGTLCGDAHKAAAG